MLRHKEKGDVGNLHQHCTVQGAMAASHDGKRGRRAGVCDYPSCHRRGSVYVRLTKHIEGFHKITRYQYDQVLEM